jgi:hypothetical protein
MNQLNDNQNSFNELKKEIIIKRREARRAYKLCFGASNQCRSKHDRFGSTAVILSVIAGSAFMAETISVIPHFKYIPSLLTALSALFSGLITFKKYLELAQDYHDAARKWEELRDNYSELLLKISHEFIEEKFSEYLEQLQVINQKRIKLKTAPFPRKLFEQYENIKDKTELEEVDEYVN